MLGNCQKIWRKEEERANAEVEGICALKLTVDALRLIATPTSMATLEGKNLIWLIGLPRFSPSYSRRNSETSHDGGQVSGNMEQYGAEMSVVGG